MISVLLIMLMQAGGAYTHLPKLTLFPPSYAAPAIATWVKPDALGGRCSVHMPRMAIPKDVEFQMGIIVPGDVDPKIITAPVPECPAAKPGK
jgi:hypothetical protein